MTVESEAAADMLTGAVVASTVEPDAGTTASRESEPPRVCLNCGTARTDAWIQSPSSDEAI